MAQLSAQLTRLTEEVQGYRQEAVTALSHIEALTRRVTTLEQENTELREELAFHTRRDADSEARSDRAANLVIKNVPASVPNDDHKTFVLEAITSRTEVPLGEDDIQDFHIINNQRRSTCMTVVKLKPHRRHIKQSIFKSKVKMSKNQDQPLYVDWDLTPAQRQHRRELSGTYLWLRQNGFRPFWQAEVLYFFPKDQGQDTTTGEDAERPNRAVPKIHEGNFHSAARKSLPSHDGTAGPSNSGRAPPGGQGSTSQS